MSQAAAFNQKLTPLSPYLDNPRITEIAINRPGELWILYQGEIHMRSIDLPELSYSWLKSLSQLIAFSAQQTINTCSPLLSATLPYRHQIYRVQIIWPPAVERNTIALCIRKPSTLSLSLTDYEHQKAFEQVNLMQGISVHAHERLKMLFQQKDWKTFLSYAVKARMNLVISAGTNAGKTTLLNALLQEIHPDERVITIEDTREIMSGHANSLHLLYARKTQQDVGVNPVTLLESVLRLNPDRILMGELRGAEAWSYLELLNSGHTGTMTTIHADSPVLMFERLAQMVLRFNPQYVHEQAVAYAKSLIHVVIQCQQNNDGARYISDIWYNETYFKINSNAGASS